jgi:hypothetical protein
MFTTGMPDANPMLAERGPMVLRGGYSLSIVVAVVSSFGVVS